MRLKTINIYTFLPGAWAETHKMRHFILVFHCFPHVRVMSLKLHDGGKSGC